MASKFCGIVGKGIAVFFEYDTPKVVHIRSKSIGIINRLLQLAVITYIIVWVFVINKRYQKVDTGICGTTTKLKGIAHTNYSTGDDNQTEVWDSTDVVVPAEENNAFFVTTNFIETLDQSKKECPEATNVLDAACQNDTDCPKGKPFPLGHGFATGKCNIPTNTCIVKAWCPLENDSLPLNGSRAVLQGVSEFTVLLKNHVYFPFYKKTRSNIIESTNKTYLSGCKYSKSDPFCPIFTLDYIVTSALAKSTDPDKTFADVAKEGAVFAIRINWDCDFDYAPNSCKPTYEFDRLDKGEDSKIAKGYNYRYSNNYVENGTEKRKLVKAFGLLFIITSDAQAGKFNVIPTLENLGSGIALLAIATVLCDIVVLYLHKYKELFREHKYEQVRTDDAFRLLGDSAAGEETFD